ncbi:uncharacterized protein LOC133185125 [Saccostrea echinata]|uniref:uncharacterized protein LOC133185125 n=1 Tax=Saccostrea echinata TaxID=191078 RepID=UPI002A81BD72|nr:uncharacterized protein LOC133185125 [Saccostrea echinata]
MDLREKCESFIQENCSKEGKYLIETRTLVDYAACAEKHNLTLILPFIIELCSKRNSESMKNAKLETKVTAETQQKIRDIRLTSLEQEIASTLDNVEQNILQLMELAWETQNDAKMVKCENRLVAICKQVYKETAHTFSRETLLDYIIAAERYELKNLLTCSIELASKCNSMKLKNEEKYKKITNLTKYTIDTKRLKLIEKNHYDAHNLFPY